jgi:hypothetical protein
MALDEQMTKMLQRDIKDAETRSRKEITEEQIDAGKTAAGLVADMTPFVGGVKGAIEAPEDLEYAKNLMAQGYEEKDLKKMGLGGAFTILTGLGFLPGAKIATDVTKSAIKSSVKKQTDNLITPKRQAQIDSAKTLEKGERRKFLKDVNRPVPKVFHGALNMSDDIQEQAKSVYTKAMDDYAESLNQQDVRISDMFLDESKYKKPKLIKKKDGLTAGEIREINAKNKKAIETAKQKAQKSHIEPEKLETSSGYIIGAKIAGSGDNYYSEYVDFDFVRSEDGKFLKIYDSSDATLVNTIPITNKGIAKKDLVTAIDKYNSKLFEESSFSDYEIPSYKTKAQQLEMEGFAPYTNNSFTNARRRPFEGDKSMFGSSQTGHHLEMRNLKALSTSRDPLVSNKHGFANRVLANIVYADLPKSVKRDLSPEEYSTLADRGNYFYSVSDQNELNERMTRLGSPLSLPKSQHLESEIAIQQPEKLNVKRLSDDTKQVRSDAEPGPTRNTGKLSLSERVREGQQLVNRLFEQQDKVMQYSIVDLENPINAKKVYNEVRSMFKDAQSLAKYTEQYGARGTYDSYIETLSNDRLFVNKLELAARGLPEGEQKKNLVVLADLLDNMPDNTGRQEALARAKTETRGLSDKELLNIMYDRPNLVPPKEYDVPGLGKEVELLDVLPEMGYNDKKRMLFLATQKLNRGGLVQMEKGGVVPMKNMEQQMELFANGGLMDEGGMVDEVSGNEVPSGSTREEVRDDIPAQLSEGEFVFPADVVRYFGLEKLMQMRQEAKAGLARMEAMGQMGNADEATLPDNLPFTIDDLDMEDEEEYNNRQEFAVGGLAAPLQNTTFTPTGTQVGIPGTPTAPNQLTSAGTFLGTAVAPVQAASAQPVQPGTVQLSGTRFTPTTVQGVMPTFQETIGAGVIGVDYEMVDYVNEAGQVIQLRRSKSTGEMLDPIPEGYTLKSETPVTTTPTTVGTARVTDDGGSNDETDPGGTTDVTGIGYDKSKLSPSLSAAVSKYGAGLGTLADMFVKGPLQAFSQIPGITNLFGAIKSEPSALDNALTSAAFGGILDNYRELEGGVFDYGLSKQTFQQGSRRAMRSYVDTRSLDQLDEREQGVIAGIANVVMPEIQSLFQDSKGNAISQTEARNNLEKALANLGLSRSQINSIATKGGNFNQQEKLARALGNLKVQEIQKTTNPALIDRVSKAVVAASEKAKAAEAIGNVARTPGEGGVMGTPTDRDVANAKAAAAAAGYNDYGGYEDENNDSGPSDSGKSGGNAGSPGGMNNDGTDGNDE